MNGGSNSNNNTNAPMDTDAQGSQQTAPVASGPQFPTVAPPQASTSYAPPGVAQQQYPAVYPQVLPSTGYAFGLPQQQQQQPMAPQMPSMPHMGMQFGPPAGIPLMSFSTMTWAPVANQQTLVTHGSNCPLCAEFLRHYAAGASEQSFRDTQTRVQTELQGQFWAHFERHTRSEGERDRERIAELETRLQTLQAEHDSEQERLRQYREEHDEARLIRDRLEQERNKVRRQLEEEQRRRQAMSMTATSSTRISMPSNQSASHRRRDPRGERPRRRIMDPLPVVGLSSAGTMSSASFSMPYITQPSMAGPSTSFATPYPAQPNMAGPSASYQSMASRSPIEHPIVDFENTSSNDEVDEHRARRLAERRQYREARRNPGAQAAPRQGAPFSMSSSTAQSTCVAPGWPHHIMAPPTDSDPRLTGHYYNYVPLSGNDASCLISDAHHDTGEVAHHIHDLIGQVNRRPELTGVRGLQVLQSQWRRPDGPYGVLPRGDTPPGYKHISTLHLPRPTRVGPDWKEIKRQKKAAHTEPVYNQPTLDNSVGNWQNWMSAGRGRIPVWMDREFGSRRPTKFSMAFHLLSQQLIPRDTLTAEHGWWISMTSWLFSVPGLYQHLITTGQYPVVSQFRPAPYPNNVGAVTIFQLSRWYASRGVTVLMADRYMLLTRRNRNERGGREVNNNTPFTDGGPNSIADVRDVPNNRVLGPIDDHDAPLMVLPGTIVNDHVMQVEPDNAPAAPAAPFNAAAPPSTISATPITEDAVPPPYSPTRPMEDVQGMVDIASVGSRSPSPAPQSSAGSSRANSPTRTHSRASA
ncbi:hypothetical protein TRAPUB_7223 [Trametes pubescens]|uniref:Uncharacterized protein n=1 Tax=Trametes pubescens TaxID=154538 RepID=A0A1M2V3V1_TRAPU|nr:hypothetical protein TRAPUB_7223 [Trametes pubescens]